MLFQKINSLWKNTSKDIYNIQALKNKNKTMSKILTSQQHCWRQTLLLPPGNSETGLQESNFLLCVHTDSRIEQNTKPAPNWVEWSFREENHVKENKAKVRGPPQNDSLHPLHLQTQVRGGFPSLDHRPTSLIVRRGLHVGQQVAGTRLSKRVL